jgi:hypothetical protein
MDLKKLNLGDQGLVRKKHPSKPPQTPPVERYA